MVKSYEVRDPIYGFIEFNDWEKQIINTPEFQRLRRIKQNALTEMVYPGTSHNRFEHSLGVMYLTKNIYEKITDDPKNKVLLEDEYSYTESGLNRDKQLIRLVALLHDIGHAPFSHASEAVMPPKSKNVKYSHEEYTSYIIKERLKESIEDHEHNKTNFNIDAEEVAALIESDLEKIGKKIFWKILIDSQLDADRADYLLRDSLHAGVKYGIYDLDRLLETVTLGIDPESGEIIPGIKNEGWQLAESLIIARYKMFSQVYYHKTRRAFDIMIKEAIKESLGVLPSPKKINDFLELDDYNLWCRVKEDENEWFKRIKNRNHLRLLDRTDYSNNEEKLKKLEKELENKKIEYWEDDLTKSWYKPNIDEEIMIIDKEGNPTPLSKKSKVVRNLEEFDEIRLYVKPEDRDEAKKIKKKK